MNRIATIVRIASKPRRDQPRDRWPRGPRPDPEGEQMMSGGLHTADRFSRETRKRIKKNNSNNLISAQHQRRRSMVDGVGNG